MFVYDLKAVQFYSLTLNSIREFLNIFISVLSIGIITFILSFIGVWIGNKFGSKYEKKAQIIGGLILIILSIKILIEHLFF